MKRKMKLSAAKVYGRFMGFIVGTADKAALDIIENQQKALDYSIEENQVLKELLEEATGKKRVPVRDCHRRRLAVKAIALNIHVLANIVTIFQPQTLLRWHTVIW